MHGTRIPRNADASGVWEWGWAPGSPVSLNVSWIGRADVPIELGGGGPTRTVVLKPEHRVTGRVTDASTGRPIPAFTVIPVDVFRKDFLEAERGDGVACKDGRLAFVASRTNISLRLRVEAAGYRTQDGPEFRVGDDAARTQDFRLLPSPPRTGAVLDAAGRPAAGVEVLLATPTQKAKTSSDWGNWRSSTDAAGRFAFPDPGEAYAVIARGDFGYAFSLRSPPTGSTQVPSACGRGRRSAASSSTGAGRCGAPPSCWNRSASAASPGPGSRPASRR